MGAMADGELRDLMPTRPAAWFAIGALGGFVAVLAVALLILIAARAPDDLTRMAMDQPAATNGAEGTGEPLDGLAIATANGCTACHSVDGSTTIGPSWLGAFGSERVLENGQAITVDRAYLLASIVDPRAQIAEGYPEAAMPTGYGDRLSSAELDAIVEFIAGLDG